MKYHKIPMDNTNHKTTPQEEAKARAAFEAELEKDHPMVFKKKELIAIFNILTQLQFKYGDWVVLEPIVKKIEPIVAVASNIPPQDEPKQDDIITGVRKDN